VALPPVTASTFNQRIIIRDYSRTSHLILDGSLLNASFANRYFYIKNNSAFTTCQVWETLDGVTSTLVNATNPDNINSDVYKIGNSQNSPYLVIQWTGSNFHME
jgi:hypothetical protein